MWYTYYYLRNSDKRYSLSLLNIEDLGSRSTRNVGILYSEEWRPHNHVLYFLQQYVNVKNSFLEYVKTIFEK